MVAHELKPQGRRKSLESEGEHVRRTRHIQRASKPPSPVSRTNSRSYPFVPPTRQSLDTNQRRQTFQHGQIITICRPDREVVAVRLLPAMLKEKVGSSHKHQPGLPKRPGLPTKQSYDVYLTEKQTGWYG